MPPFEDGRFAVDGGGFGGEEGEAEGGPEDVFLV